MRTLSTQYTIKEVSIVTKGGSVEVSSMFEELNIFDSLFLPIVSGNILMVDSIGLIGRFIFDGSEVIKISMTKDGDSEIGSFQKAFRIYKQSDRRNLTQTSEKYILHFVSDELIFSDQQRVNQSYVGPYSYIVDRILKDYLGVSNHALHDATTGIRSVVIPNLRPLEAIDWCAKRSVDQYSAPNYLFYSNLLGFNFASLSNLLNNPSIMDIKFEPKNLFDDSNQALRELSSARSFEVVVENDVIDRTRSGVNAGTFIGFDPMTRTFDSTPMNYNNIFKTMLHANENPNVTEIINRDGSSNLTTVESRKVLSIFGKARKYSQYIQRWDPESLTIIENYEDLIFQRKSILKNLTARRLKLVMPGNFQLTSGFNVFFTAPSFARREVGEYNEDKSISGKYIIIATRHIITMDRHETVIEVSTDSTRNDKQLVSSVEQNNEILQYGI